MNTGFKANKSTLGGYASIDAFVEAKLRRFACADKSFSVLFEFMFSEKENVMFEKSRGYRIEKITYGECRDRILRRVSVLREKLAGVPRNTVVGLHLSNSAEWIELFWAILAAGCKPLLMNLRLGKASLDKTLLSCGAAAVIAEDESAAFSVPVIPLSALETDAEPAGPSDFGEGIFVMSSGTSENVKICEYTAEELYLAVADSANIIKTCPAIKRHCNGSLKLLALLPFCHIFGLVAVYIWFGFFSRTFVLLNDMAPATVVNTIRRHGVTHIFAVPLFWNKVRQEALRGIGDRGEKTLAKFEKGLRLSAKLARVPFAASAFRRSAFREVRRNMFGESVRFMISGGSEIDPKTLEFFNGIGYHLANGYGMTEIGITSVELSSDCRLLTSGSVGLPFSSVKYTVGEGGQLYVSGGSMARRIIEGGRVTERPERFPTGDLAEYKNGRYYILGRMDDLVISPTGENLNPSLIEDRLTAGGLRDCCLCSVREEGGIVPVLVGSLRSPVTAGSAKAAYDGLRQSLAENGLDGQVQRIVLVREPLLGENDFKLNRSRIAKRLADGGFTVIDPNSVPAEDGGVDPELIMKVRELFAKALGKGVDEISAAADFFLDCGGTSLDYFAVASELAAEYGVAFPVESGKFLSRPADIARFITDTAEGR